MPRLLSLAACLLGGTVLAVAPPPPLRLEQAPNTWVKRSPLPGGPVSPGLAYEAALAYDPVARRVVRWGGHNQGGGGEQNAELWLFDPRTARWELRQPNTSPPGVCCAQQNVFDTHQGRYLRFPAFSGQHGWHWFRENYHSNSSVWAYDVATNTWRDRRPLPAPHPGPLRCASWDSHFGVAVVTGGEGAGEATHVYDPYANTWTKARHAGGPPGRSGGNLAYDRARRLHVLFGSQLGKDPRTWLFDLSKGSWRDARAKGSTPADRNDAVLAYDEANKVIVAVLRAVDRVAGNEVTQGHLETWAYDAGANAWRPLSPPREPDGWRNRRRLLTYAPDQGLFVLENYVNPVDRVPGVDREQQMWTYRYADAAPPPTPPAVSVLTLPGNKARVTWRHAGRAKYRVWRAEGPTPWLGPWELRYTAVTPGERSFTDEGLKRGTAYAYKVEAGGDHGLVARAYPRIVEDGTVSVRGPREVLLAWSPPQGAAEDLVGYHVERAAVEVYSEDQIKRLKADTPPLTEPSVGAVKAIGPFERLTKAPVRATSYRDRSVDLSRPRAVAGEPLYRARFRADQLTAGKPYRHAVFAYRVRAVNHLGAEGGPSPWWLTIPPAPQYLFAREGGADCHLKWEPNLEGLKGYRVYRMEGPRRNGPGQKVTRLTPKPVRGTTFTDRGVGKDTRRYWVVAVDALGQEGTPSAPAWHYRQYRRYYAPFVGPWHQ
jgi:hypothetical protein